MGNTLSVAYGKTAPLNPAVLAVQAAKSTEATAPPAPCLSTEAVSTGDYQQAAQAPVADDICFPDSPAVAPNHRGQEALEMLSVLRSNPRAISPEQQNQLQALATGLGFPNAQSLAHGLRHLPAEDLRAWAATLPTDFSSSTLQTAQNSLKALAENRVQTFFKRYDANDVQFRGRHGREWCAQGYLSVLNSFTEMAHRLPHHEMQRLVQGTGDTALTFERYGYETIRQDHPPDLLGILSQSMRIASIQNNTVIHIGDAALNMSPAALIENTPALQDFIAQLNTQPPSTAHATSLQQLLNAARPQHRQLPADGILDANTWSALDEFEVQQYLIQILDILEDDQSLASASRQRLTEPLRHLQLDIFHNGLPDNWQTRLTQSILSPSELDKLSPHSQERFQSLQPPSGFAQGENQLQQAQLERLIGNWFGIIDEGNQRDFMEQVITHEMGHRLHNMSIAGSRETLLADWRQISFQSFEAPQNQAMLAPTLRPDGPREFASAYAQVNPEEDFAESFRLFIQNPAQLRESNPLKYLFLAGVTGTYRGREKALLENLRAAGHADLKLQTAVRTLRGQNADYAAQRAHQITNRAGEFARRTPLVSPLMHALSATGTSDRLQNMFTGRIAEQMRPQERQFDVSVASMLPGLERQLNMQPVRAVSPSQPHYVLDTLSLWASDALGSDVSPQARSRAQNNLARFAQEGLAALTPPSIHPQIPIEIRHLLEQPEERARLMSMAYLHATPQIAQASHFASLSEQQAVEESGPSSQRIKDCDTFMADLRQFMGEHLFEQLPADIRRELEDPNRRQALSGYGLTHISSEVQQQALTRGIAAVNDALERVFSNHNSKVNQISALLERYQNRAQSSTLSHIRRELNQALIILSNGQLLPANMHLDTLIHEIEQRIDHAEKPYSREELHRLVRDLLLPQKT